MSAASELSKTRIPGAQSSRPGFLRTGDPNTLYFTAGINDQKDGLFGAIVNAG